MHITSLKIKPFNGSQMVFRKKEVKAGRGWPCQDNVPLVFNFVLSFFLLSSITTSFTYQKKYYNFLGVIIILSSLAAMAMI